MTGMELQLKLSEDHVELPIIFLSGHGDMSMAIHAFRIGAADFLEKNVTSEELQAAVKKAVTASMKNFSSNCEKKKNSLNFMKASRRGKASLCRGWLKENSTKVIAYELDIAEKNREDAQKPFVGKIRGQKPGGTGILVEEHRSVGC